MNLPAEAYGRLLRDLLAEGHPVITRVRGGSMWPAVPDGAVVRLVPVTGDHVQVGRVVLRAAPGGRLLCHRLSRRAGDRVQTWGDACGEPDSWGEAREITAVAEALQTQGRWRPVVVRSPLRMAWRYLKRRLVRAGRGVACPDPCGPDSSP